MIHLSISDLHLDDPFSTVREQGADWIGEQIAALRPDVITLVGDIIDQSLQHPSTTRAAEDWDRLNREIPRHVKRRFVPGNHDYCLVDGLPDYMTGVELLPAWHVEQVGERRAVWTHGHLADGLALGEDESARAQQLACALAAGGTVHPGDVTDAGSLLELQERVAPWLRLVWGPQPARSMTAEWWGLIRCVSARPLDCPADRRSPGWHRIERRVRPPPSALGRWAWLMDLPGAEVPDLLVTGHTHAGTSYSVAGVEVRDCGGWTTGPDGEHPHAHAVGLDGAGHVESLALSLPPGWVAECARHGRGAFIPDVTGRP